MTKLFALLFRLAIESACQSPLLSAIFQFGLELVEQASLLLQLIAEDLLMSVELSVLSLWKGFQLESKTNRFNGRFHKNTLIFPTRCHVLVNSKLTVLSRFSCLSSRCSR